MKRSTLMLMICLVLPHAALAQQQPPSQGSGQGLGTHFFPPEFVMQNQASIGLGSDQRAAITAAMKEFQAALSDVRERMQEATEQLAQLLESASVDPAAAMARVDRVLEVEGQVKREQFRLMIAIRNTLTAEQQAKLREIRRTPPNP